MPKVSIIIPVFNAEKYLRRCLDSVVNQSLEDIEIICIDDGSTDRSLMILKEYAARDSRIILFSQPTNRGSAAARNVGLEKATGEYIYFVDNDDYIAPETLEVFCTVTDRYIIDVVYSNPNWECESPDMIDPYSKTKEPSDSQMILQNGKELFTSRVLESNYYAAPWMRFIRNSYLKKIDCKFLEKASPHEDNLFSFRVDIEAGKVVFIKRRLYTHCSHSASTMITNKNLGSKVVSHFLCGFEIMNYVLGKNYSEKTQMAIKQRINGLWNRALVLFDESEHNWKSLDWQGSWLEENLFRQMFRLKQMKIKETEKERLHKDSKSRKEEIQDLKTFLKDKDKCMEQDIPQFEKQFIYNVSMGAEVKNLKRWLEELENYLNRLLKTKRWKTGNFLSNLASTLRRQKRTPAVINELNYVFHQINQWTPYPLDEQRNIEILCCWIEQIRQYYLALLETKRWRLGDRIISTLNRVSMRQSTPMVTGKIDNIFRKYDEWEKDKVNRYETVAEPIDTRTFIPKIQSSPQFLWLNRKSNLSFTSNSNHFLKSNMKLPISVIMPTLKSRNCFTQDFVLPMIYANNPAEIIIVDDEEIGVQEKRNKGASKATQKYLFFCDDDTILPSNHLYILFTYLEERPDYAFAYTDYQAIVMDPLTHPKKNNYYHKALDFNLEVLKQRNYIDTSSLLKNEKFPGFDPTIKRLQDWDLWLTICLRGEKGLYVKETGIIKYYLDEGITSKYDLNMAKQVIINKHCISIKS